MFYLTTSSSAWENVNKSSTNFTGYVTATDAGAYISHGYAFSDNSSNIVVAGSVLESGVDAGV